jgi:hypothetical protein
MRALNKLEKQLKIGKVYRRENLVVFSKSIDRELQKLVKEKKLKKLETGLYYCPRKSEFGDLPPDENKLIEAFLKGDKFFVQSLNTYNSLGVGATQLYNEKLVYNNKRDGHYALNGRKYFFIKHRNYPKKTSLEFLLVDLMNNINLLAEDKKAIQDKVAKKAASLDKRSLMKTAYNYGGVRTRKFFNTLLNQREGNYA